MHFAAVKCLSSAKERRASIRSSFGAEVASCVVDLTTTVEQGLKERDDLARDARSLMMPESNRRVFLVFSI